MSAHWFPAVIDGPTVLAARERVAQAAAALGIGAATRLHEPPHEDPRWLALQAGVLPSAEIAALRTHAGLRCVLEQLVGGPVVGGLGDVVRAMPPGAVPTPPHQDAAYIAHPEAWTVWIPLVNCPLELGPLGVVAGSAQGPVLPHGQGGLEGVVLEARAMEAGDVLIFHARTIHGALPNTTDRVRYSVDLRFAAR